MAKRLGPKVVKEVLLHSPCLSLRRSKATERSDGPKQVRGWGLITGVELGDGVSFAAADVGAELINQGMLTVAAGPKVMLVLVLAIALYTLSLTHGTLY